MNSNMIFALIVLIHAVNTESNQQYRVVETNNGKVQGIRKTSVIKQLDYFSFKGIPFGKSPTGALRFKAPMPIESWSPKIRNAFEHGPICIQPVNPVFSNDQSQSEDCLFLNVYVPADIKPDEKLAVMVHIHGGGYGMGSGNVEFSLGPDFLLEQRVILVTMNYRLGVFGFISFGTPEYSGNMGLKDQQLALKWVHSNIEHFSGDKQRITLLGISAGGSSTHFHMLSEESRKYFRNAIPMSGAIDNYWAFGESTEDYAYEIAAELDETKNSTNELIDFFKTVPAESLVKYGGLEGFTKRTCNPRLTPILERRDAINPFIVDAPSNIYEKTKFDVDAMFTLAEFEFITFYSKFSPEIYNLENVDKNFSLKLPFRYPDSDFDSKEYQNLVKEVREFYFEDAPVNKQTLMQYISLLSDVNFAYGIDKAARCHATKTNSKTFYMRFSVDSKLNLFKNIHGNEDIRGAGHADDVCYVFYCHEAQSLLDEILKNKDDKQSKVTLKTIEYMTKILTNFAKYGEPTHDGEPVAGFCPIQNGVVNFLDVTNDGLTPGVNPNHESNIFWQHIEQHLKPIKSDNFRSFGN